MIDVVFNIVYETEQNTCFCTHDHWLSNCNNLIKEYGKVLLTDRRPSPFRVEIPGRGKIDTYSWVVIKNKMFEFSCINANLYNCLSNALYKSFPFCYYENPERAVEDLSNACIIYGLINA